MAETLALIIAPGVVKVKGEAHKVVIARVHYLDERIVADDSEQDAVKSLNVTPSD